MPPSESKDENESGSEYDGSSVSSFSESGMPDHSFAPMPARLTLPIELHRLVLSYEAASNYEMWGTYRFVCKAWQEQVEFLAKTEWIRDTTFYYPGETMWDDQVGRVFLNGDFTFQRLDGELAIFQITDCAEEYREPLIEVCQNHPVPDVEVGECIHDVEIDGMSVDWDTLTLTCPWRTVIARVLAEELRVEAYRKLSHGKITAAKRMRHQCGGDVGLDNMMKMFHIFGQNYLAAYVAVRKARLGRADPEGDERLKRARQASSFRGL